MTLPRFCPATLSGHRNQQVAWWGASLQVKILETTAYSPELNPIERLWQDVKAQLAWVLTAALDELEDHVGHVIIQYSKAALQTLTSYPYFVQAVNALDS
jgi:DDE superfamily endonuclease